MTTATATTPKMTAEEFFEWSNLPENESRKFELHTGVPVEMPPPGEMHGLLAMWIGHLLMNYVLKRGKGMVLGSDAGLVINNEIVLAPDVMLIDETIAFKDANPKHCQRVPSLCVEILSPSNRMTQMIRKVNSYHRLGVKIVWLIDPEERSVHVYQADELSKLLDDTETLTGNGILPDFSCPVADLFRLPGTAS